MSKRLANEAVGSCEVGAFAAAGADGVGALAGPDPVCWVPGDPGTSGPGWGPHPQGSTALAARRSRPGHALVRWGPSESAPIRPISPTGVKNRNKRPLSALTTSG